MVILETIAEVRRYSRGQRGAGRTVGLVPTMGCLHDGHLSLVGLAKQRADRVVLSLFVNPTQFGPGEDYASYPRTLDRDLELCRREGVDVVFSPGAQEMYPEGAQTTVRVQQVAAPLCGAARPGHFDGVATVVAKLFLAVEPDLAVFGEKDYQQLQVIRTMVRDLNMPVEVLGAPIVRELDGLAMSSRNRYLDAAQRRQALCLSASLAMAQQRVREGERAPEAIRAAVLSLLKADGVRPDYAELVNPDTLQPVQELGARTLLAVAAFVGPARLIDNRILTQV